MVRPTSRLNAPPPRTPSQRSLRRGRCQYVFQFRPGTCKATVCREEDIARHMLVHAREEYALMCDGLQTLPRPPLFQAERSALVRAGIPPSSIGRFRKYLQARFPDAMADQCQDSAEREPDVGSATQEVLLSPHDSETPTLYTPSPIEQVHILPHIHDGIAQMVLADGGDHPTMPAHGPVLAQGDDKFLPHTTLTVHQLTPSCYAALEECLATDPQRDIAGGATWLPDTVTFAQNNRLSCGEYEHTPRGSAEAAPSGLGSSALSVMDSGWQGLLESLPPNEECYHDQSQSLYSALLFPITGGWETV